VTAASTSPGNWSRSGEHPAADDAPIGPARPSDKIAAAVAALAKVGTLRTWHTDAEVRELGEAWLKTEGCRRMPGLTTWKRELARLRHLWRR
jgi:hypothetical protein